MVRHIVPLVLVLALAGLQAQMWLGRGGVPEVKQMRERIAAQREANVEAQRVNERLSSEVDDLKAGLEMVEEKARGELGMVKPHEILVQVAR